MLELVSAQFGITIVPRILANKLNGVHIKSIPIVDPSIVWEVGFITRENPYQSAALKELLKIIDKIYSINNSIQNDC